MFDNSQFFSGARGFYPLTIDQSLRFNDDDSAYLSRTPATAGNRKTWTWSGWVKRGNLGTFQTIFNGGTSSPNYDAFRFTDTDKLQFFQEGATAGANRVTDAVFRDVGAWYHVVVKLNSIASEVAIFVNGVEQSCTGTQPTNTDRNINNTVNHSIGRSHTAAFYLDGYLAEVHFTDGTAYDADAFGELKSGVWVAKTPSVTYGTNGFYLDFANSADIGNDVSGEGNDWTPNFFTASDVVLDSPTDNFATLNPLANGGATLSDGNLKMVSPVTGFGTVLANFGVSSGQWYWEVTNVSGTATMIGVVDDTFNVTGGAVGYLLTGGSVSIGYYASNGNTYINGSNSSYGASYTSGDVIGVALDMDAGTIEYFKNGTSQGVKSVTLGSTMIPAFGDAANSVGSTLDANFGQQPFTYAPPTDYLALSTANLPDPVIDPAQDESPSDYFNTVLYTGTGAAQSITGVGFQPDFLWIKVRNNPNNHRVFDSVRGEGASGYLDLITNNTDPDEDGGRVTALSSDGFTVSSNAEVNSTGHAIVAWNWKANGSGVTNTDGSITSTVSANTTSGFSIVSYTGNGSTSGETYGHGLDQAPEMIITKARETNSLNNWPTWHKSLNANSLVYLNLTSAQASETGWMPTLPSDTLVYLGTGSTSRELTNNSGVDYIAYCFHSVEGFSKFGSYVGNGSADGPFVYCGFRPAFVMVKRADVADAWWLIDNKRDVDNAVENVLLANTSDAESVTGGNKIDFLSNGFKCRGSDVVTNASGGTYIFMAFAENPFKYSNAR